MKPAPEPDPTGDEPQPAPEPQPHPQPRFPLRLRVARKPPAPPDWESFESWRGPPGKRLPRWLEGLFSAFMYLLSASLIFGFCGALFYLAGSKQVRTALHQTPQEAWTLFVTGGTLGLLCVIGCLLRKDRG